MGYLVQYVFAGCVMSSFFSELKPARSFARWVARRYPMHYVVVSNERTGKVMYRCIQDRILTAEYFYPKKKGGD